MIKAIILTATAVFTALGICDFIHILKSAFLIPDVKTKSYCIVYLRHGYALSQLRFFAYKIRWYGDEYCNRVFAVIDDLNETEKAACEKLCYNSNIELCYFEKLNARINCLEIGEINERQYSAES